MDEMILTTLIATVPLALFSGSIGCIVLWRSMAYYGDAMAHAAMLGVALSLLLPSLPAAVGVFAVTLALSLFLPKLSASASLSYNTVLAIFAYSALAAGILLVSLQGGGAVDIHRYLLGDLLTLTKREAYITAAFSCAALAVIWRIHKAAVLLSIDESLALVSGISVPRISVIINTVLAGFIAFAVPLVGIVLITSMLIIPAATARIFARTPKQMMLGASALSVIGLVAGLAAAFWLDTPAAPTITSAFSCVFLVLLVLRRVINR